MSGWSVASLGVVEILAQSPANPTGPEFGKASPIGLMLTLALLVCIVLLVRSMNKKIKNLPETFEPERPEADQAADEGTDRRAVDESVDEAVEGGVDEPPNLSK